MPFIHILEGMDFLKHFSISLQMSQGTKRMSKLNKFPFRSSLSKKLAI